LPPAPTLVPPDTYTPAVGIVLTCVRRGRSQEQPARLADPESGVATSWQRRCVRCHHLRRTVRAGKQSMHTHLHISNSPPLPPSPPPLLFLPAPYPGPADGSAPHRCVAAAGAPARGNADTGAGHMKVWRVGAAAAGGGGRHTLTLRDGRHGASPEGAAPRRGRGGVPRTGRRRECSWPGAPSVHGLGAVG
jgi:hypothetical protein